MSCERVLVAGGLAEVSGHGDRIDNQHHAKMPVMSSYELIARLASALAWPIAAVIGVIVLRKSIAQLVAHRPPQRVKAGPFEVEWDRLLAETEKEVEAEIPGSPQTNKHTAGVANELSPAAEEAPLAAVQEAYATVERELRKIIDRAGGESSSDLGAVGLARLAERKGCINAETLRAVEGLSVMRNLAVHGGGRQLTPEQASEYLALVDGVLFAMRGKPRDRG
jgi:hypothetical protein